MAYYWARQRRVPLDDTALVAVDVAVARRARLWDGAPAGTPAGAGMVLVPAADLSPELHERLRAAGAEQPVLRHGDTLLVVLPEVRVESADPGRAATVESAVADYPESISVERPEPGRLILRPGSGLGGDALDLANYLHEHAGPDAAQARFLRIVDHPL
ncbi:hypothetical protein [Paractinoplanes toevensis]|uniref:Uncharacterized protein n=1 Tax=Paractinoplanes toevensis TaxID=571911 RepID=A0A919TAS6_9ACTN|nr:hypothetical protein [Actinoplanes toevensis]GIM91837.1 hypothetical protein Ato02nite_036300 [Actinoplanes toevensis]